MASSKLERLNLAEAREEATGWAMEPSHPAASLGCLALDLIDELEEARAAIEALEVCQCCLDEATIHTCRRHRG